MSQAQNMQGDDILTQGGQQREEIRERVGFGTGESGKKSGNHAGVTLDVTFDVSPKAIPHGTGRTPQFAWPMRPGSLPGAVLQWISADDTNVTLGCNVVGAAFKIYVE